MKETSAKVRKAQQNQESPQEPRVNCVCKRLKSQPQPTMLFTSFKMTVLCMCNQLASTEKFMGQQRYPDFILYRE